MKRVYLYGIADAETKYSVVRYLYIEDESISIRNIVFQATWLKLTNPTIEHVYAIDERKGLVWDYREAIKKNSVESFVIFKNILEKEGLMVI